MVYKFFDKKFASLNKKSASLNKLSGSGANKFANEPNYQLANELDKAIIRKFKKGNVYSSFRDNIWGVDLSDMQLLSKYNEGVKYLLCAIDLFSKYAWVVPIKDKKGTSIVNAFKIWVDQVSEFYNNTFKDFLKINNMEMYSTYNEGKICCW